MKFYFLREQTFRPDIHRFGWNAAVNALKSKFHSTDSNIACDDFLEFTFHSKPGLYDSILPYTFPWIGFLHHPSNVSFPFDVKYGAPALFASKRFQDSLPYCKCLITLSNSLKRDARALLENTPYKNLPIINLFYPTDTNVKQFDYNKFKEQPKLVNLGWWLRKLESLYKIQTNIPKFFLLGSSEWALAQYKLCEKLYDEKRQLKLKLPERDTTILPYLSSDKYDDLLSSSVCFIDLIDSSANSAIIECLASATPILVNPHDAVVEYLGRDYPFYWDSIEEATSKLHDKRLIIDTHNYLKHHCMRQEITYNNFCNTFYKYLQELKL